MGFSQTIEIYGGATAGAGKDPGLAYSTTSGAVATQDAREFNLLTLQVVVVVAGAALASVELLLESSPDSGTTWVNVATKSIGAGAIVADPAYRQAVNAPIDSEGGVSLGGEEFHEQLIRVKAKRTGGDATTRVIVYAFLGHK